MRVMIVQIVRRKIMLKKWDVWCGSCDVHAKIEFETLATEIEGHMFYKRPDVLCAECHSVCILTMKEENVTDYSKPAPPTQTSTRAR